VAGYIAERHDHSFLTLVRRSAFTQPTVMRRHRPLAMDTTRDILAWAIKDLLGGLLSLLTFAAEPENFALRPSIA
jgi:hypothetical protein